MELKKRTLLLLSLVCAKRFSFSLGIGDGEECMFVANFGIPCFGCDLEIVCMIYIIIFDRLM